MFQYLLKQWAALKVFPDCLLKLQIPNILCYSPMSNLRWICTQKCQLQWVAVDIYLTSSWFRKYPLPATSTLTNSCQFTLKLLFEFHVYNFNLVFLFEFHYLSKNEEETKKVVDEEEYKGMFVNFYFYFYCERMLSTLKLFCQKIIQVKRLRTKSELRKISSPL